MADITIPKEKVKVLISPDQAFTKLYEAVPIYAWYCSQEAVAFVQSATAFVALSNTPSVLASSMPKDIIGMHSGYYVHIDPQLEGRTLELRNRSEVVSTITLEEA